MKYYVYINFVFEYEEYEDRIDSWNDDGADYEISGYSDNKSYDINIIGESISGEWANVTIKEEWTSNGVLKEFSIVETYNKNGDITEIEETTKLKSSGIPSNLFDFSISGIPLGSFSIAIFLGVSALFLILKRTQ